MMQSGKSTARIGSGFTLIEMLIVLGIIGILAAIVVPVYSHAQHEVDRVVFTGDVRQFADAALRYFADTGDYIKHAGHGKVPAGWEPYIDEEAWVRPSSIGGTWEVYRKSHGVESAVGVHFSGHGEATPDDDFMRSIDLQFDDGDLTTGVFRKLTPNRFAYIVVECE